MNSLKIIFQDQFLMVIDKPPYLVVDPSETQKADTLADILIKEYGIKVERGGIVHRLDKDTSGLLLVAKTEEVKDQLQIHFSERKVKKEYIALVHGFINESGVVKGGIGRNPDNRKKFIVMEGGKEAVTEYMPVNSLQLTDNRLEEIFSDFNKIQMRKLERMGYNQFTLLRCFPMTGRTHQIRVHLKYINHPIVGDAKYTGRKVQRLDHRWCKRQFLHAQRLEFTHPLSGERLSLESPLPDDLQKVLKNLEEVN